MKEKILLALKAKFPDVNLSKKRLDEIAARIEKKTGTDEAQIDAVIDSYNEFQPFSDIAKMDDKMRDLESKSKTKPEKVEDKKDEDDGMPDWFKKYQADNDAKIEGLLKARSSDTIKSQLEAKLKDVPATFWGKRIQPSTPEEIEAFVTEVTTDFEPFKKVDPTPTPRFGNTTTATGTVDPAVKKFVETQKQQQAKTS